MVERRNSDFIFYSLHCAVNSLEGSVVQHSTSFKTVTISTVTSDRLSDSTLRSIGLLFQPQHSSSSYHALGSAELNIRNLSQASKRTSSSGKSAGRVSREQIVIWDLSEEKEVGSVSERCFSITRRHFNEAGVVQEGGAPDQKGTSTSVRPFTIFLCTPFSDPTTRGAQLALHGTPTFALSSTRSSTQSSEGSSSRRGGSCLLPLRRSKRLSDSLFLSFLCLPLSICLSTTCSFNLAHDKSLPFEQRCPLSRLRACLLRQSGQSLISIRKGHTAYSLFHFATQVHEMHVRHFHKPPQPLNPRDGACKYCRIAWPETP